MTTAPECLMAARRLLLQHLGRHGLASAEVGIVGDAAHRGGYHCGRDRVVSNDYSVVESSRDRTSLSDYASALDIGSFSVSVAGKRHTLASFSVWLVAQCKAGSPDTRDIREVIYSPDGKVVRRWDRLGKRFGGDDSHLWHTHISYHRDATKAGRDQSAVFRRYLTTIGLIEGEPDVDTKQNALLYNASSITASIARMDPEAPTLDFDGKLGEPVKLEIVEAVQGLQTAVADLAKRPPVEVDYDQLADALLRRVLAPGAATPTQ